MLNPIHWMYTSDGQRFDPAVDTWTFHHPSQKVRLRLELLKPYLKTTAFQRVKDYFACCLRTSACNSVLSRFESLLHAFRHNPLPPSHRIVAAHLKGLSDNAMTRLRPIIRSLAEFSPEIVEPAATTLFSKKFSRTRYASVLTWDPENGPLTEIEYQLVCRGLKRGFSQRLIDRSEYLLIVLLLATGARPIQMALLRCSDLQEGDLWIPRVKNRRGTRTEKRKWRLVPELAEMVQIQVRRQIEDTPDSQPEDIPLFPWPRGNLIALHCRLVVARLKLEPTLGKKLKLCARRIRHTVATRAAEEGSGLLVIAELLDHTDTQSAQIYIDARPTQAARITAATLTSLVPLAQAFAGTLVTSEADAIRGTDLTSRVGDPAIGNVGTCGYVGNCSELAPLCCYTCVNFQPWREAPHAKLLQALIDERARLLNTCSDPRYAQIRDLTISAIAEVVKLCAEGTEPN